MQPQQLSEAADRLIERIIGYSDLYKTGQNPSVEHVVAAAWQSPGGNIYAGDSHYDAAQEAVQDGNSQAVSAFQDKSDPGLDWRDRLHSLGWKDGFITSTDRFITRQEALVLGKKQRQLTVQPLKGSTNDRFGAASEYFR